MSVQLGTEQGGAIPDDNPAVRTYAQAAFRSLEQHLDPHGTSHRGAHVLDFGCGTGLLTAAMAAHAESVVGLDLSAAMVQELRRKALPNVTALVGHLGDHALGPFDGITASSVCAFLDDYPRTVTDLVQRLRPGGWFVQFDWELNPAADEPMGLSRDAVRLALEGAGLVDLDVRTAFEEPFEGQTMAPLMGVGRRSG